MKKAAHLRRLSQARQDSTRCSERSEERGQRACNPRFWSSVVFLPSGPFWSRFVPSCTDLATPSARPVPSDPVLSRPGGLQIVCTPKAATAGKAPQSQQSRSQRELARTSSRDILPSIGIAFRWPPGPRRLTDAAARRPRRDPPRLPRRELVIGRALCVSWGSSCAGVPRRLTVHEPHDGHCGW